MKYYIIEVAITQKVLEVSEAGIGKTVDTHLCTYQDIFKTNQLSAIEFIRDILLAKGVCFNDAKKESTGKKTEIASGS